MTTDWIKRAEAMEAACMRAADRHHDNYEAMNKAMDAIVWHRWFAWFPVRTFDMYCGPTHPGAVRKGNCHVIPGKWRWLTYVKRHNLYERKFKELVAE